MKKLISLSVLVSFLTTTTAGAAGPLNAAVGGLLEQERIDDLAPEAIVPVAPPAPDGEGEGVQAVPPLDPLAPASEVMPASASVPATAAAPVLAEEGASAEVEVPAEPVQSVPGQAAAAAPAPIPATESKLAAALSGDCKGVPAGELGRYIIGNPADLHNGAVEPGMRTWLFSDMQNDIVAAINNRPNSNVSPDCLFALHGAGLQESTRYWSARGQNSKCAPEDTKGECGWVNSNLAYLKRMVDGVERRLIEAAEQAQPSEVAPRDDSAEAAPARASKQRPAGPATAPTRKSASRHVPVQRTQASAPSAPASRAAAAQADVILKGVGKSCSKPKSKPVEKELSIAGGELRAALCCDVFKSRDSSIKDKSQCDALTKGTASMPGCAENAIRGVLKGVWSQISALGVIFDRAFWSGLGTLAREFQKSPKESARRLAKGLMQSLGIDTEYAECLHPGYQDAYWCGVVGNVFTQVGMMAGGWTAFFKILKAGPVVGVASKLPGAGKIAATIRGTRIAAGKAATAVTSNRVVRAVTLPARVAGKVVAAPFKVVRHPIKTTKAVAGAVRHPIRTTKAAVAGTRKAVADAGQVVKSIRGFSPKASLANMRQSLAQARADLANALKGGGGTAAQSPSVVAAQQRLAAGVPNRLGELAKAEQRIATGEAAVRARLAESAARRAAERQAAAASGNRLAKLAEAEKRIAAQSAGAPAKAAKSVTKAERKLAARTEVARREAAQAAPQGTGATQGAGPAPQPIQPLTSKEISLLRREVAKSQDKLKKMGNTLRKRSKQLSAQERDKLLDDMKVLSEQIAKAETRLVGAPPKMKLRRFWLAGFASGEDSIHHVGVQEKRGDPAMREQWKKVQEQEEKVAAEQQAKAEAEAQANGQEGAPSAAAPGSPEAIFAQFERKVSTDAGVLTILRKSDPAMAKLQDAEILNRLRSQRPQVLGGKSDAEVIEIFRQNMLQQVQLEIEQEFGQKLEQQ